MARSSKIAMDSVASHRNWMSATSVMAIAQCVRTCGVPNGNGSICQCEKDLDGIARPVLRVNIQSSVRSLGLFNVLQNTVARVKASCIHTMAPKDAAVPD